MTKVFPIHHLDWRDKLIKNKNMKRLLVLAIILSLFVFAEVKDKTYKVELPIQRWQYYVSGIEAVKLNLKNSDIQSRTVNILIDSVLNPLTNDMISQLNKQLIADTAKKK